MNCSLKRSHNGQQEAAVVGRGVLASSNTLIQLATRCRPTKRAAKRFRLCIIGPAVVDGHGLARPDKSMPPTVLRRRRPSRRATKDDVTRTIEYPPKDPVGLCNTFVQTGCFLRARREPR